MFKMWLGKLISRFIWWRKTDGKSLSGVQGNREESSVKGDISTEYPNMEAKHRRLFSRESISQFTRRLWDEGQKLRGMERLLRKQSLGKRENEEVQRRKEATDKRNLGFYKFSKSQEYRILSDFFKSIEEDSYLNLRHPELAKDTKVEVGGVSGGIRYVNQWISQDYHAGYHNGRIETIEDFRSMISNAVIAIEKQKLNEELQSNETSN